ncbi:hypothetical protein WH87_14390, partial [Devosia epidermidihirudinis]
MALEVRDDGWDLLGSLATTVKQRYANNSAYLGQLMDVRGIIETEVVTRRSSEDLPIAPEVGMAVAEMRAAADAGDIARIGRCPHFGHGHPDLRGDRQILRAAPRHHLSLNDPTHVHQLTQIGRVVGVPLFYRRRQRAEQVPAIVAHLQRHPAVLPPHPPLGPHD